MKTDQKIVITGGKGVIGTVLRNGLKDYSLKIIDLPDVDLRDCEQVAGCITGSDVIIHLAHNPTDHKVRENYRSGVYLPDNSLMAYNVYEAALASGAHRVVMASSVHADNFYKWRGPGLLTTNTIPTPDSPYGADKIFIESLGRYYATKGLEVICIRFGGVRIDNKPPEGDQFENKVWLYNDDCVSMIESCINSEKIQSNFELFYAVSNNEGIIHDTSNTIGWVPR